MTYVIPRSANGSQKTEPLPLIGRCDHCLRSPHRKQPDGFGLRRGPRSRRQGKAREKARYGDVRSGREMVVRRDGGGMKRGRKGCSYYSLFLLFIIRYNVCAGAHGTDFPTGCRQNFREESDRRPTRCA